MNTADFIRQLPKAELHLHLEGAVPWALIREGASDSLPEIPDWYAADYRYDDFEHFGQAVRLCRHALNTTERYYTIAQQLFQTLVEQNVRYVEVSYGVDEIEERFGITVADAATAIQQAAPPELTVSILCAFHRHRLRSREDKLVQSIFESPYVDGIDLHGPEMPGTVLPYVEVYRAAQERGLITRAHAGELCGPDVIWETLTHLNVKRIAHGTRAIEDEALVDYLCSEGITLEMCPTSNAKLRVVEDISAHPIKIFFRRGLPVTVSTDDPTFFGCTLTDELHLLVDKMGFSPAEVAEIQKNAFRVAKLPDETRQTIFREIDALVNEFQNEAVQ
jgi:adenosine deaminase